MSSLANTVFLKNIDLKNAEIKRMREDTAYQQEQQDLIDQRSAKQLETMLKLKRDEFDRQMKVAQLQSQNLALLGRDAEKYADPAIQEGATAAYTAGEAQKHVADEKFDQTVGLKEMGDSEAAYRQYLQLQAQTEKGNLDRAQREAAAKQGADQFNLTFDQRQKFHDDEMRLARSKASKVNSPTLSQADAFKIESGLRNEFQKSKTYKNMMEVSAAADKLQHIQGGPAGDLSIIFAYMKMLDPESTVREGEQASAANAGGVPARISSLYNQVLGNGRLSDAMRQEFRKEALNLYAAHKRQFDAQAGEYKRLASQRGAAPENVIIEGLGWSPGQQNSNSKVDDLEEPY